MKYWLFNGSDVLGPFTPKELAADKSFGATSLVCPENFSDDGDHWQLASTFEELAQWLTPTPLLDDEDTVTLDQELDTLLHEKSPLLFDGPTTDGPGLQLPKKPAKPGPIEDYFNHIEKEDLGEILGIPAPNENSDMDLAHALESQLAQTSSTRRREREALAAYTGDDETVQALQQSAPEAQELPQAQATHHVATATEVFATKAPVSAQPPTRGPSADATPSTQHPANAAQVALAQPTSATSPLAASTPSMPTVDFPTLPKIAPEPLSVAQVAGTAPSEPGEMVQPATDQPEELVSSQPAVSAETPVSDGQEPPAIIPDPAQLRREKVEVNSINARLKHTQEMKDVVRRAQAKQLKKAHWEQKAWVAVLALGVIVGTLLWAHLRRPQALPPAPQAASTARELLDTPAVAVPQPPKALQPELTQENKALAIVQNYPLSGSRGPLATYLNHIYQSQLAQGYTATWQAEALHKNTYIVKYQLTKTRKEPIIYIFQADVALGKLTGALNNISLDLVGKIQ